MPMSGRSRHEGDLSASPNDLTAHRPPVTADFRLHARMRSSAIQAFDCLEVIQLATRWESRPTNSFTEVKAATGQVALLIQSSPGINHDYLEMKALTIEATPEVSRASVPTDRTFRAVSVASRVELIDARRKPTSLAQISGSPVPSTRSCRTSKESPEFSARPVPARRRGVRDPGWAWRPSVPVDLGTGRPARRCDLRDARHEDPCRSAE